MSMYQLPCPVCDGNVNFRSVTEDVGVVEQYGDCEQCSYIFRMCYSWPYEAICSDEPADRIERARKKKIDVLSEEEYACAS